MASGAGAAVVGTGAAALTIALAAGTTAGTSGFRAGDDAPAVSASAVAGCGTGAGPPRYNTYIDHLSINYQINNSVTPAERKCVVITRYGDIGLKGKPIKKL